MSNNYWFKMPEALIESEGFAKAGSSLSTLLYLWNTSAKNKSDDFISCDFVKSKVGRAGQDHVRKLIKIGLLIKANDGYTLRYFIGENKEKNESILTDLNTEKRTEKRTENRTDLRTNLRTKTRNLQSAEQGECGALEEEQDIDKDLILINKGNEKEKTTTKNGAVTQIGKVITFEFGKQGKTGETVSKNGKNNTKNGKNKAFEKNAYVKTEGEVHPKTENAENETQGQSTYSNRNKAAYYERLKQKERVKQLLEQAKQQDVATDRERAERTERIQRTERAEKEQIRKEQESKDVAGSKTDKEQHIKVGSL
jgi:hypothetical protein